MHELLHVFLEPLTLGFLSTLLLSALWVWVLMERGAGQARAALATAEITHETAAATGDIREVSRRLREILAGHHPGDGRPIWIRPPATALESWIDDRVLTRVRFVAAGWLTGMALVATFSLIALVLVGNVGPAIRDTADMTNLSQAVERMGAKFVVSAIGIIATILLQWRAGHIRSSLHEAAHLRGEELGLSGISRDALEIERAYEGQTALIATCQAMDAAAEKRHLSIVDSFGRVQSAVESLRSIDVSIKDIGAEVTTSLRNSIGVELGNAIRQMLRDLSDDLHQKLGESFGGAVREELAKVTSALAAIEAAIAGQASSEVGKLIEQIRDVISGGFASESSSMRSSLQAFGDVVPRLERQLTNIVETLGSDFQQRNAVTMQMNDSIQRRVSDLLDSLAAQERSTADTIAALSGTVARSQEEVAASMDKATATFLSRSNSGLKDLLDTLKDATGKSSADFETLATELRQAIGSFAEARSDLTAGANAIRQAVGSVVQAQQSVNGTVEQLSGAADAITEAARRAESSGTSAGVVVNAARDLVAQQKDFAVHLEGTWPTLLESYVRALEETSRQIAESWKRQAEQVGTSVERIGASFQSSATEFSGGVDDLAESVRKLDERLEKHATSLREQR